MRRLATIGITPAMSAAGASELAVRLTNELAKLF